MRKMKKMLSLLLAFVMMVGLIVPSVVHAQETNVKAENALAEEELSKELEFYFNEIGHIDDNGNYTINNIVPLKERAESGDETAKSLLEAHNEKMFRSRVDFGKCILKDYFGVYIDLIQGKLWDAFIGSVQREAWTESAKIVLKVLGKSASKANLVAIAGQLALAAYNCKAEW